jgi:KipI family sensor histidine kinase inhibitor
MSTRLVHASDRALLVVFGDAMTPAAGRDVRVLLAWLRGDPPRAMVDLSPAYATLLIRYDPLACEPSAFAAEIGRRAENLSGRAEPPPRSFTIPVRYGGAFGPDLPEVAKSTGLSEDEVVAAHAGAAYEVRFIGFSPGFPYLAGLPERLFTPRRAAPRTRVPAGSVAIAGAQAGIYPFGSPGGWSLIGRTEFVLFDPALPAGAVLEPGDHVRFVADANRP